MIRRLSPKELRAVGVPETLVGDRQPPSFRMKFVWCESDVFPERGDWDSGLVNFAGFRRAIPDRMPAVHLLATEFEAARHEAAGHWRSHAYGPPDRGGPIGFAIVDQDDYVDHYWFSDSSLEPDEDLINNLQTAEKFLKP
ncbi:hypothetical protein SAMN05444161_8536 [Rhizobiales bacterium GAS191]|nr:hypothetical protein SAMN05444161_8536 [Rhizobiales bacterium GAS191]